MKNFFGLSLGLAMLAVSPAAAESEPLDYAMVNRILDEGLNRSEVMETATHLTDVIGPRLTNSPGMRAAAQWTRDQFAAYGLQNAQLESFNFGRGWTYDQVTVRMTAPRSAQLQTLPVAWRAGTNGSVEAEIAVAAMADEEDFTNFEGKLAGKIVLIDEPREQTDSAEPVFVRFDDDQLAAQAHYPIPEQAKRGPSRFEKSRAFEEKLTRFLAAEGAVASVQRSRRDGGMLEARGHLDAADDAPSLPAVVLSSEDYDRLIRLADRGEVVKLSINVAAQFHDENPNAQNVWAEIPGRGGRPEIVMAGAHLDSWHTGDGAVDNAAGAAVVMEAARILSALGVKPKRTIRFALWDGEEQGHLGSLHHVEKHFASKPDIADEERRRTPKISWLSDVWPVRPGRDFERLSVYFNLDTGSGRIRGIWGEGNPAVLPIFDRWFEPFHEMGAETVILSNTLGTDHEAFQAMGLPAFTFIQDPLDYDSRLHHTNVDTASHLYEKDLRQAAIIMASFLWNAADRDERLPRMPIPTKPKYADEKEED